MTARRPRRRRSAPAATLPRPTSAGQSGERPGASRANAQLAHGAREHHITRDYSYVRSDLLLVTVVTAITLGLVVATWLVSPSW